MAALTIQMPAMTISDDEQTFFAGLGERVASRLLKAWPSRRSCLELRASGASGGGKKQTWYRLREPVKRLGALGQT